MYCLISYYLGPAQHCCVIEFFNKLHNKHVRKENEKERKERRCSQHCMGVSATLLRSWTKLIGSSSFSNVISSFRNCFFLFSPTFSSFPVGASLSEPHSYVLTWLFVIRDIYKHWTWRHWWVSGRILAWHAEARVQFSANAFEGSLFFPFFDSSQLKLLKDIPLFSHRLNCNCPDVRHNFSTFSFSACFFFRHNGKAWMALPIPISGNQLSLITAIAGNTGVLCFFPAQFTLPFEFSCLSRSSLRKHFLDNCRPSV